jgi:hypothetical protein
MQWAFYCMVCRKSICSGTGVSDLGDLCCVCGVCGISLPVHILPGWTLCWQKRNKIRSKMWFNVCTVTITRISVVFARLRLNTKHYIACGKDPYKIAPFLIRQKLENASWTNSDLHGWSVYMYNPRNNSREISQNVKSACHWCIL